MSFQNISGGKSKRETTKQRQKSKVGKNAIIFDVEKRKGSKVWHNGILSCDQSTPPSRDREDNAWNPTLDIPLCQMHVCTSRARARILDKLLMLHINYVWNMEPKDQ